VTDVLRKQDAVAVTHLDQVPDALDARRRRSYSATTPPPFTAIMRFHSV
jgi:hypothetical protein